MFLLIHLFFEEILRVQSDDDTFLEYVFLNLQTNSVNL